MRRQTGPVQQWIDSIPSPIKSSFSKRSEHEDKSMEKSVLLAPTEPKEIPHSTATKYPTMTMSAPINVPCANTSNMVGLASSLPHKLVRDPSLQSDSSHCSSVESLLELRKADPEAILLGLGFGGCSNSPQENGTFSRIPKRFLQPSKLKGIAINDFMKKQQETSESFDSVSLGYRGLTGSPYVEPSEIVQKIMQRLREHESHEYDPYAAYNSFEQYSPVHCNGTLSVLSPNSRQFLERPRSKSPDMRNKRMIIGQKSFAFGNDGDLIEIKATELKKSFEDNQTSNISYTIEHSDICSNIENNECDVTEEILSEPVSLENDLELYNAGFSLPVKICKEYSDSDHVTLKNPVDIRRASDGFCHEKLENLPTIDHERRHSDGIIQVTENDKEKILSQKRKTFKRQARISDTDAVDSSDSEAGVSEPLDCKQLHYNSCKHVHNGRKRKSISSKLIRNIAGKAKLKNKTKSDVAIQTPKTHSKEMRICVQSLDALSKEQPDSNKCYTDKGESKQYVHKDEDKRATCCCGNSSSSSGTKKYWKKVEKIIQGNKDLENMVTKNRIEMAEIREMLNSVLSVRLEPGF